MHTGHISSRNIIKGLLIGLCVGCLILYNQGLLSIIQEESVSIYTSLKNEHQEYLDLQTISTTMTQSANFPHQSGNIYTATIDKPHKIDIGSHSGFVVQLAGNGLTNIQIALHDPSKQRPSILSLLYHKRYNHRINFPIAMGFFNSINDQTTISGDNCLQYINMEKYRQGIHPSVIIPGCRLMPYTYSELIDIYESGSAGYIVIEPIHISNITVTML